MLWTLLAVALAAPSYTLSFAGRAQHLLDVSAELEADGPSTGLFMATWTPGSYLVREYAQHVEGLQAVGPDGGVLAVRKTAKNRWQVDTEGIERFTLTYRVYARSMTVQGNWVDADFAVLNGAPTFIVPDGLTGPYTVAIERPEDWAHTISALAEGDRLVAPTYDVLVDTPIAVGNPAIHRFELAGVPHLLVDIPAVAPWDSARAVAGVEAQARAQLALWGQLPYPRYVFINVLGESRGGLEHRDSTHMITSRFATSTDAAFHSWLGLVSHEHFHAWNGKRLRPEALGPFDYEAEVHTESLWIAEGFTAYYDDLLLARAGILDQDAYLGRLGASLSALAATPGRLHQPVAQASHDAWIEFYRRDEHSENSAVSYYTKGAVIAWVLDARIRAATRGQRSLDDAMRLAWTRHAGERGYAPAEFTAALSEVAGEDLGPLVHQLAHTTDEVALDEALAWFGLRLEGERSEAAWLGATLAGDVVRGVHRNGPAWRAGLNVGDELLAVGGERVRGGSVDRHAPGDRVELLVARRGTLRTLMAVLGTEPSARTLAADPRAPRRAVRARADWLGLP